jgi:sucrose phosphorylase
MNRIQELLTFLYGATQGAETAVPLERLLAKYKPLLKPERSARLPPNERTILLITYGDQVSRPHEAPLRTLDSFLHMHIGDVLTSVHILPFYPYSSDDGFAVMDYYSVNPKLGTWEDVTRLGAHFDLMFDAVINHASVQGEWFQRFLRNESPHRDYFLVVPDDFDTSHVVRPRTLPLLTAFYTAEGEKRVWTTFSEDQADLNYKEPALLLQILELLLFYVMRGARLLRLDAIAFLWKESGTTCLHLPQTHAVIQLLRSALNQVAPDVILVTETNVPHADNVSYFGDGQNEAQWVYNFALPPLVLHTLQTGNATKLALWAQTLRTPSDQTAFLNFLASHDGIGLNPVREILSAQEIEALVARTLARGGLISYKTNADGTISPYEMNINFFDALAVPGESQRASVARFIVAQSILLALAGVPGIYFHSLFGSRGDRAGAEESGIARRINRQKFTRVELEAELNDPTSLRSLVITKYMALLRVRGQHRALDPTAPQRILALHPGVFAILRSSQDNRERILCLHNVTADRVEFAWTPNTEQRWQSVYGSPTIILAGSRVLQLELQPYEVVWLGTHNQEWGNA